MTLRAFDPTDIRTIEVNVAGPAAFVVAKQTKTAVRTAEAATRTLSTSCA